jgi:hypothetical protein
MTLPETLRHAARIQHHRRSHELAEELFALVEDFMKQGYTADSLRVELDALFEEYRSSGHALERDALVEVLDELDAIAA